MAVTAKLVPDRVDLLPDTPSMLTLRLYNDGERREVALVTSGDLCEHVRLDSATATVDTDETVDVDVTVLVPVTVPAGSYVLVVEVTVSNVQADHLQASLGAPNADAGMAPGSVLEPPPSTGFDMVMATATLQIAPHGDYTIALQPMRSRGAKRGRHTVRVTNAGNEMITLELTPEHADDISVDVKPSSLTVAPGSAGDVALRLTPATTHWSGPARDHEFTLRSTSADGRSDALTGTYQQRPRVPNWLGPAAAGACAALLLGALTWFAALRPWVEDTADTAAADAIEADRTALQERIDELEAAAAEAEELPLGAPVDFRLEVAPTGGNSEQDTEVVDPGTIVSITDVVFQNPSGAVGTVSLRRGDDVILESELANFRDFDLHFVAPLQFDEEVEIVLHVECRTPGAGASACPIGASLVGFIDEID